MACVTNYTVHCTDVTSGKVGCFIFDVPHWQKTGEFKALSPVFGSLKDFFTWCADNGNPRQSIYAERMALIHNG